MCWTLDGWRKKTMSKHMQLTVQVRPYYKNGMKGIYPRIAEVLGSLDTSGADASFSLFDLVGRLDRLLYDLEGNPPVRKIFLEYHSLLQKLQGEARTHMADWKLAEVDQLLYRMEDIFDDIEWKLGGI